MAKIADYTKYAASYCPNLPGIVFKRAMLSASREYFTQTQAWKEQVTISLVADMAIYAIPDPTDADLIDTVTDVSLNDKYLSPLAREYFIKNTGTPKHFSTPTKTSIHLYPTPKESGELSITLTLKPSIVADEMPEALFQEHFEGLIAGCIWQIKRMPGTDWYDPQSAFVFKEEFDQFIDKKRIEILRGQNNSQTFIQYPNFL
jgi:hypothetical protein